MHHLSHRLEEPRPGILGSSAPKAGRFGGRNERVERLGVKDLLLVFWCFFFTKKQGVLRILRVSIMYFVGFFNFVLCDSNYWC